MNDYRFKSAPFGHQERGFYETRDLVAHGEHWDPGTGKTKLLIDVAAYNAQVGRINGLLVVAPNVVHQNWVDDQLPRHLPEETRVAAFTWHSAKAGTKRHQEQARHLLGHKGLSVLAMSYDAVRTDAGRDIARDFLKQRRVMMTLDEAHRIKTPGAKTTKLVRNAGKLATMRRTATGTPVTQSPFDVYAPVCFLDDDFWRKQVDVSSFTAFKQRYAIWVDSWAGGSKHPELKEYQRLDELQRVLASIATRLTKEDAGLDLPPKLYKTVTFDLSPAQRRVYEELKTQYLAELDAGKYLEAPLALVRLTRLHQIACGYAPAMGDDSDQLTWIPGARPRLELLLSLLSDTFSPVIVWAARREDCRIITEEVNKRSRDAGDDPEGEATGLGGAVRIDGTVTGDARERALADFHAGRARILVANQATLGEGVTLNEAKLMIYYSQDYRLGVRVQSEDRNHRIGQDVSVQIVDLVARDTVDPKLIESLVEKHDVAAQVSGDKLKAWLSEGRVGL